MRCICGRSCCYCKCQKSRHGRCLTCRGVRYGCVNCMIAGRQTRDRVTPVARRVSLDRSGDWIGVDGQRNLTVRYGCTR